MQDLTACNNEGDNFICTPCPDGYTGFGDVTLYAPFSPGDLFISSDLGNWEQMRFACIKGGGDLVSLHTPVQQEQAGALCGTTGADHCYIGLQLEPLQEPPQGWTWTDETPFDYSAWGPYEGQSGDETKVVMALVANWEWADWLQGEATFPGVCLKTERTNGCRDIDECATTNGGCGVPPHPKHGC